MRILIAGLGNIFEGDDGFGVAVARLLTEAEWPSGVEVHDFGIRGVHLAYQLLDGYDLVVIVDAVSRAGEPGTLYVIDHAAAEPPAAESTGPAAGRARPRAGRRAGAGADPRRHPRSGRGGGLRAGLAEATVGAVTGGGSQCRAGGGAGSRHRAASRHHSAGNGIEDRRSAVIVRFLFVAAVGAVTAAVVSSIPDIKRYLKMRAM